MTSSLLRTYPLTDASSGLPKAHAAVSAVPDRAVEAWRHCPENMRERSMCLPVFSLLFFPVA